MSIRRIITALVCSVPLMGAAFSASAVTVAGFNNLGTCSTSDVSTSSACIGAVTDSGNQFFLKGVDSESKVNANNFFGTNSWSMVDRIHTPSGFQFGNMLSGSFGPSTSGTFAFTANPLFSSYMLVLKINVGYAAYLLGGTSGTWTTNALLDGGGLAETSQLATLYASPDAILATVPVPAAGLLMLTGVMFIGCGALVTRRRTQT